MDCICVTEEKNKLGYDPRILGSLTVEKNFLKNKRKSNSKINYEVMKYQGNFNICNLPLIDGYFKNDKALIDQYKEIIYLTLLYLRFKTNQKDFDDPNKLQEIYQIIQKIVFKYGGNVHKILTDGGGFIFQIAFGTLKSKTSQHEVMGVLASFEICFKLKKINVFPFIGISTGLIVV